MLLTGIAFTRFLLAFLYAVPIQSAPLQQRSRPWTHVPVVEVRCRLAPAAHSRDSRHRFAPTPLTRLRRVSALRYRLVAVVLAGLSAARSLYFDCHFISQACLLQWRAFAYRPLSKRTTRRDDVRLSFSCLSTGCVAGWLVPRTVSGGRGGGCLSARLRSRGCGARNACAARPSCNARRRAAPFAPFRASRCSNGGTQCVARRSCRASAYACGLRDARRDRSGGRAGFAVVRAPHP